MSSSQQANAFCREVIASGEVFVVEHEQFGPVTWPLAGHQHARPVWSSRRRVVRMLEGPLAAPGLVVVSHSWDEFCAEIVPETEREGLLIGLNWSGPRARGYNLAPSDVVARVDAVRAEPASDAPPPEPGLDDEDAPPERLAG